MTTRRSFLRSLGTAAAVTSVQHSSAALPNYFINGTDGHLSPWTIGTLDIHHISTGRGNCTLMICPDGTTLMVDAGAIYTPLKYTISPKPDNSRRPGEWLARYALRHLSAAKRNELDYCILTHFHSDHVGAVDEETPLAPGTEYRLTGVSDVARKLPIKRIIDRCYPTYDYPAEQSDPDALNYIRFIRDRSAKALSVERLKAGSNEQIRLLNDPDKFPAFSVRNLAVNGRVWTGAGTESKEHFPDIATLRSDRYPTENMCSLALKVAYGNFAYFTGGDLEGDTLYGTAPWRDIETVVARAAGPVDVAVATHHGYVNAMGPNLVRALQPRAFIILAWDSAHPTIAPLDNMLSRSLYPGDRDVYATALKPENKIATRRLAELRSGNGHVIVRVAPGGDEFTVLVTDNSDELDRIIGRYGPFKCRVGKG